MPKIKSIKIRLKRDAEEVTVRPDRVLTRWIGILPGSGYSPPSKMWVIGNEYGAIVAVWAQNAEDAIDEAVNCDTMDSEMVSQEDFDAMSEEEREDLIYAGNASEPFYQNYLWMEIVDLRIQSAPLLAALRKAEEQGASTLAEVR